MKHINENIKKLRLEKGLTQQEVADQLFVTRQCISRWEQGKGVPDVESLERLSKVFSVTLSEILDDESIKSLTINEAVKNQKNKKFLWFSLLISCFAVIIVLISIFYFRGDESHKIIAEDPIESLHVIITSYDPDESRTLVVERDGKTYSFNLYEVIDSKVLNDQLEEISIFDLKVGDTLEIKYQNILKVENIVQINVVDSRVERSLLGVIFVTNGETYETIDAIPTDGEPGVIYYLYDSSSSRWNIDESRYDIVKNGNHYDYTFEMTIYFDRFKIKHDAQIGLVYSDGIDYVETYDTGYSSHRTYTGEVDYMPDFPFYSVHSKHVTYNLNFKSVFFSFN